jgi:hypothetical protein
MMKKKRKRRRRRDQAAHHRLHHPRLVVQVALHLVAQLHHLPIMKKKRRREAEDPLKDLNNRKWVARSQEVGKSK